jgi:hypothetical protein
LERQLAGIAELHIGELKMEFLHYEVTLNDSSAVRIDLSGSEANVKVMDDFNFRQYEAGGRHQFFGGHYRQSPAVIRPPSNGRWHVTVDTGSYVGRVNARVSVV